MKILMIAPTPYFSDRGCHVRILEETRALQSLGNEVITTTYHNGNDVQGIAIRRIPNIPWYNKLEAGPSYHMLYLDLLLLFESLNSIRKSRPDIIHAHLHEGTFIGKICSSLLNIPLVADMQGSLSNEMADHGFLKKESFIYRSIRQFEMLLYRFPNAILVSSNMMGDILKKEYKSEKEKIFIVEDGVNTEVFHPDIEVNSLKKKIGIPDGKKIVVFLGLLNEYQGIDYLLKAIPLVLKDFKDVHFLIMGYPNVDKYQEIALELGLKDNVTFTGRIDYKKANEYLALGDIAVSAKISETESNGKIYNYMATGLPTVVFDNKVNRDILGDLGIYAIPKDQYSLAEKICTLLRDEELSKRLGIKVREKAVRDYSWNRTGEKIMEVYRMCNKNSGGKK
ncbi:MAG: glycosyltransferase family 4 protein [Candidatus Methanoperedens sp.]|nr:glycosyltransferase family 4 protein [Candidatus Methanoperedens sp.]